MSKSENTSMAENLNFPPPAGIPPSIQFWVYLISDFLSIPCSLFVLYHLLFDRKLRRALNNHVIIVLLVIGLVYQLTYIPWTLHHLYYKAPWLKSPIFYLFTFFIDYGSYSAQIALFCWATIERHILIFHDRFVSTKTKRLLFHYLPILAILTYRLVYFSVIMFGSNCENAFDFFIMTAIFIPCAFDKTMLGTFDLLAHQVVPTLIIVLFGIALILRALKQKRRLNQAIRWRKHRKMTIQLVSVTVLYLIFNSPWTLVVFTLQFGFTPETGIMLIPYVVFFRSYVIFLFPYVCIGSLSELRAKLRQNILCSRRHIQVFPVESLEMARSVGRRVVRIDNRDPNRPLDLHA